ncbi:MAG: beta-phosphoglucomutase [Christensenellaceae bacterium]
MEQQIAFLFDLDGVITDTARYHYAAWKCLADTLELHFTQSDNEKLKGISRIASFDIILQLNDCQNKYTQQQKEEYANVKNEIYVEMLSALTANDVLPGIRELIASAKQAHILLAVASASKNAQIVLDKLCISSDFDYIADAAKIKHAKPNPEIFLNCASALGVHAENCIGFEDAQAGIEAIHAAKMFAVGIGVTVTTQAPDLALHSTNELQIDTVLAAMKRRNC